jgi:hypothetical protein
MTPEQVNKSIGQMRGMFGLFGLLTSLGALLALASKPPDIVNVIVNGALAVCFWTAFNGLGTRSSRGYTYARICSFIFVLGFPVLTFFGLSYLTKLGKPEIKQAFEANSGNSGNRNFGAIASLIAGVPILLLAVFMLFSVQISSPLVIIGLIGLGLTSWGIYKLKKERSS